MRQAFVEFVKENHTKKSKEDALSFLRGGIQEAIPLLEQVKKQWCPDDQTESLLGFGEAYGCLIFLDITDLRESLRGSQDFSLFLRHYEAVTGCMDRICHSSNVLNVEHCLSYLKEMLEVVERLISNLARERGRIGHQTRQ